MPAWCAYRDTARKEHVATEVAATAWRESDMENYRQKAARSSAL